MMLAHGEGMFVLLLVAPVLFIVFGLGALLLENAAHPEGTRVALVLAVLNFGASTITAVLGVLLIESTARPSPYDLLLFLPLCLTTWLLYRQIKRRR